MELHLSEAFLENKGKDEPSLECRAIMLNINQGHNQELMEKCQRLEGYSYFVAAVFTYMSRRYELEDAINLAIDECVKREDCRYSGQKQSGGKEYAVNRF